MNFFILGLFIFVLTLLVIELSLYAVRMVLHPDRNEVRKRLRQSMESEVDQPTDLILKQQLLSDIPLLNKMLSSLPAAERIQATLRQANAKYSFGFFVMLTLVLGASGFLLTYAFLLNSVLPYIVAIGLAILPTLYVQRKKKKRMVQFEKQLPEALELIARALRAGHAFSSGMKLAATEFGDPLGPEFEATLDEINFGQSVPDALKFLARRVDCDDLKFFIVSVILQRETGGNLAEIIENLAHLIRERFKFRGKVRVLSAEGRLSAVVLMILPVLLGLFLVTFHPDVISPLWLDPMGRFLLWTEGILMISGFFLIRKIIKVEV